MTPLEALERLGAEVPSSAKRVLKAAEDNGWAVNEPGVTLTIRLARQDEDAVYVTYTVGETKGGKISFRHHSSGTQGLESLSASDVLEYLTDPTLAHLSTADLEEAYAASEAKKASKPHTWNAKDPVDYNVMKALDGEAISVVETSKSSRSFPSSSTTARSGSTTRPTDGNPVAAPSMTTKPPLRVTIPT